VITSIPAGVRPSERFFGIMYRDDSGVPTAARFDVLPNGNVTSVLPRAAGEYFVFSTSWPLG